MKNILYIIILPIILFYTIEIFPQSYNINESEKIGDAVTNISASIISDSLVPMTHFNKDEYRISFVPAYFDIDTAYDNPEIKGNDLIGWSAGLGGGYAFHDRVMLYGILAHMEINGEAKGEIYGENLPSQKSEIDYELTALSSGIGFDLVNNNNWSFPVYAGGIFQYYKAEFNFDEINDGIFSYDAKFTSDSFLYGINLSAAISYKIKNKIIITPYLLYMQNFNKSEGKAKFKINTIGPSFSKTETFEIDRISAIMPGLSVTFISEKIFSVSLSTGGYIASSTKKYNEFFLDGLQMKSIVLVFTYNGIKQN